MKRSDGMPRYTPPSLVTLSAEDLAEALGPAETQYVTNTLLHDALGNTTQDNWTFENTVAPNLVTFQVDAVDGPVLGPLDPKLAVYPPGQAPALGAEFTSAAECTEPSVAPRCIEFDGMDCSATGAVANSCPVLTVTLNATGTWTVSVGTDAPQTAAESQGSYQLAVTGVGVSEPVQTGDDTTATFLKAR